MIRRARLSPLAWGVALLASSSSLSAQTLRETGVNRRVADKLDTAYVEAVIQLQIANGPSAVLPALANDTTLLLPFRQFLALAEIRIEAFALRDSAVAVLEPGSVRLRFNPAARLLARDTVAIPYDTVDVVWWDGELFVASRLFDRLLNIHTSISWADLSASVVNTAHLPVVQRGRRETRRQLLGRAPLPPPRVLDLQLRERTVDGAIMSWALTASTRGPAQQVALDLGFGAGLFGGSAELRPRLYSADNVSDADVRVSWHRVFQRSRWVRQVGLGDVQSNGRRARLLQGFTITNAPFARSSEFDVENIVGRVPAGWEVELYERGRLLAYADADALGAFRVPLELRYGQNPFDLVMYGPNGETVRRQRTIRIPFSRLPAARLEYAFAAGRCRFDPCDGLVSADARYGLSRRVTLQGGLDGLFGNARGSLWQPYAVVSATPLPALGLSGEAVVNGQLRAAAEYEPTMDLRLTAGVTRFSRKGALFAGGFVEATRSEASAFWHPGWMKGQLYLRGNGLVSTGPGISHNLQRLSATTRFGAIRYGLGILRDVVRRDGAPTFRQFAFDASADAFLVSRSRWFTGTNVSGQLAVDPSRGLTAIRAAAGRRATRLIRLDAAVGWFQGSGFSLELSFSTSLPGPRGGFRSRVSSEAGSDALTYSYGSLAWDPTSRLLRLGDGSDLGRAGIRGVLFRDDNGNGVKDPGEPGLAGIPVHVGGWAARTDADGRFAAFGLFPTEPADIQIDTLSFGDPRFVLPAPVLRVRPAANSFGLISVPVAIGGEVSGYVVLGNEALAGVPVLLREMNTGVEITIITFGDGAFYKAAVPPGEYEVTLPDAVLERLNALAPPLSIFVPPGTGEKRYEDLQLRLQPRS